MKNSLGGLSPAWLCRPLPEEPLLWLKSDNASTFRVVMNNFNGHL